MSNERDQLIHELYKCVLTHLDDLSPRSGIKIQENYYKTYYFSIPLLIIGLKVSLQFLFFTNEKTFHGRRIKKRNRSLQALKQIHHRFTNAKNSDQILDATSDMLVEYDLLDVICKAEFLSRYAPESARSELLQYQKEFFKKITQETDLH